MVGKAGILPMMFGMKSEERGRRRNDTSSTPDCHLYEGTRTGKEVALARTSRPLHARFHRKGPSLLEDAVAFSCSARPSHPPKPGAPSPLLCRPQAAPANRRL